MSDELRFLFWVHMRLVEYSENIPATVSPSSISVTIVEFLKFLKDLSSAGLWECTTSSSTSSNNLIASPRCLPITPIFQSVTAFAFTNCVGMNVSEPFQTITIGNCGRDHWKSPGTNFKMCPE